MAKGTLILADGAVCRELDNEKLEFELSSVAGTVGLRVRVGLKTGLVVTSVCVCVCVCVGHSARRLSIL